MKILVLADADGFERALAQARATHGKALKGLAAPASGALAGIIAEAWDAIEGALRKAFVWGADRARETIDAATALTESLAEKAGNQAREFQDALLQRLRTFQNGFVEDTLARVRSTIVLGETTMSLENVELTHKVMLTSSLKAAITEICSLAANTETAIVARYRAAR